MAASLVRHTRRQHASSGSCHPATATQPLVIPQLGTAKGFNAPIPARTAAGGTRPTSATILRSIHYVHPTPFLSASVTWALRSNSDLT
eukprot:XP_001693181.1 predicted protein [Chlamydomonas reinhardtii]